VLLRRVERQQVVEKGIDAEKGVPRRLDSDVEA
jgi:hypothetical protein